MAWIGEARRRAGERWLKKSKQLCPAETRCWDVRCWVLQTKIRWDGNELIPYRRVRRVQYGSPGLSGRTPETGRCLDAAVAAGRM